MKKYFILAVLSFLITIVSFAQKDSIKKVSPTSTTITTQKITVEQEQWVRQNFQHIVTMKKDSARMDIRKNFSTISDASVDYMISRAAKLMQEDKQKRLALVQQMMKSLKSQKDSLTKKIAAKESELKRTKDAAKIKSLKDEITEMKTKVKELDKEIKYLRESK